jgi:hypothetical protein
MTTFIINEVKKKTRTWWKGLCRVFILEDWKVKDITRRIAELWNREKQYDWINLTIHYWSWTWIMVIGNIIKVYRWDDINIFDVSIF